VAQVAQEAALEELVALVEWEELVVAAPVPASQDNRHHRCTSW
jgi:hypothetical protein